MPPQIKERNQSLALVSHGFERIIIGYAEKAIIADTFGLQLSRIESISGNTTDTISLWLKALLYFFELYFDFAGYSQIAIGLSEI